MPKYDPKTPLISKINKEVHYISCIESIAGETMYLLESPKFGRNYWDSDMWYDADGLNKEFIVLTPEAELFYSQELPRGRS